MVENTKLQPLYTLQKFPLNKRLAKKITILYKLLFPTFLFCLQQSLSLQKEE